MPCKSISNIMPNLTLSEIRKGIKSFLSYRSTGDIYCKSGTETRMPMRACDGVMMDMDSRLINIQMTTKIS